MGKQKRMILFITIEVFYLILPNKSQTEIVISIVISTRKKFKMVFPILKCNIRYMNFLRNQQYLRNFIPIREKVVVASFFQNKFYNSVFIIRFFMNFQRQNATNVTVTCVTKFSIESF